MARFPVNPDAPRFEPEAWVNQPQSRLSPSPSNAEFGSDCYQYSIAGSRPNGSNNVYDELVPGPGEMRGLAFKVDKTPGTMRQLLESDGLSFSGARRDIVPPSRPGYYTVGLYLRADEQGTDHHFVRQNSQGGWDEKDTSGQHTFPREVMPPAADGGYQPLPERSGNRQFAGYYQVPKEGIDAGPEAYVRRQLLSHPQDQACQALAPLTDRINENNRYNPQLEQLARAIDKHGVTGLADDFRRCVGEKFTDVPPESIGGFSTPDVQVPRIQRSSEQIRDGR